MLLKTFFGMKAPLKRGVDAIWAELLNITYQEENLGEDCLEHVFWGVLYSRCRHFSKSDFTRSNIRNMHGSKKCPASRNQTGSNGWKLACNEQLLNVLFPIQWIGREATVASGYQSVRLII